MKIEAFSRVEALIGEKALQTLRQSHFVVLGAGGVGSLAIETLARTGAGKITIIDYDIYSASNINRQLYALLNTVGHRKVDEAKEHIKDIDKGTKVIALNEKLTVETVEKVLKLKPDMILDAIDDVPVKIEMMRRAREAGIPLVSSMGAALRIDPTKIRVAPLKETKVCPLAAKMRSALPKEKTLTVYSEERPYKTKDKSLFGSVMTVTGTFGIILAQVALHYVAGHEIIWKTEKDRRMGL